MRHISAAALGSIALCACATPPPPTAETTERRVREPAQQCDASGVQDYVGRTATEQVGQELLRATGSAVLRWGPPRSAMTMDYRTDRLTVSYDDDLVIQRIICG